MSLLQGTLSKEILWNPNALAMFNCILKGVLKKKIWDLLSLIEVPEVATKFSKIYCRVIASQRVGSPMRVLSSTNWVWDRGGFILWTNMPFRKLLWTTNFMDLLSPSAIKMNRNGESGCPCLMPLDGLKVEVGVPLSRMEKKEEDISDVIQWI